MKPAIHIFALVLFLFAANGWAEDNWYIGGSYHHVQLEDADSKFLQPGTDPAFSIGGISFMGTGASTSTFDVTYDDGDGYGLFFGYDFIGLLRADLEARQFSNDIDEINDEPGNGENESISLLANVWMDFNRDGVLRPYIGLGLGASQVELGRDDDTVLAGQAGLGVNWHMTDHFALDLGVRYFDTDDPEFTSSADTDLRTEYRGGSAVLALRYNFPPRERPAQDSDSDGVPDSRDRCPGTPPDTPVNANGCADSDGDGVIDVRDNCPGTPPDTPVTANGCADADGDGIPDNADACPATAEGVAVMSNGCGARQSAILQGVNFEYDKARLTQGAETILERVAQVLKESPGFVVELQGHTDSRGSEEYNFQLSQERAQAVRDFLIARGVPEERVVAKGYGESRPIADNSTPEGRASNRRVEMRVLEQRP